MAQLAIKGHPTRGNEVIEILEMLGGSNKHNYSAYCDSLCFYIGRGNNIINCDWVNNCYEDEDIFIFTLEEFLEKFPYKIGDKVQRQGATSCGTVYEIEQIKREDNQVKYIICDLYWKCCKCTVTAEELKPYKEQTMEEKLMPKIDFNDYCKDKYLLDLGNYEIKEENGKTYVVKKKPQYPKTFVEVLNFWHADRQLEDDYQRCYKKDLIEKFQDLLYARDAYWEIAGGEMGLGESWEPDWENFDSTKYCIGTDRKIVGRCNRTTGNKTLAFPTKEMRDTFYENFKELIESCKELL